MARLNVFQQRKIPVQVIDKLLVVIVGVLFGLAVTSIGSIELKWSLFLLIALFGTLTFVALPNKEMFLMLGFFFLLPIGLNYHPVLIPYREYFRPIIGVVIYGYDIPLFFLFLILVWRLASNAEIDINWAPVISVPFLIILGCGLLGSTQIKAPQIIKAWSFVTVIKCLLIVLIVVNCIRTKALLQAVLYLLLLTVLLQAFVCFAQIITGSSLGLEFLGETGASVETVKAGKTEIVRIGGLMSKNALAAYLSFIIPLNFGLMFTKVGFRTKIFFLIPVFLLAFTLEILTFSRGAWLGLGAGGILTLYGCITRYTGRKILSFFFMAFFLVSSIALIIGAFEPVQQRLFEDDYGSAVVRFPLMVNALNIILHNPLLGVGLGNYTSVSQQYDIYQWVSIVFPWPVHNDFLLIGAEMGIPAMLSFCFIVGAVLYKLVKVAMQAEDDLLGYSACAIVGGFVAFCIHHLVAYTYVMLNAPFWSFIGLGFVVIKLHAKEKKLVS